MQPFTLEEKKILITGASSGIGRGVAVACARQGAECILVARDETRLRAVQEECGGATHKIEFVDVTDSGALKSLVDRIEPIDGLVQCAGIGDNQTPLKFLTEEFVDKVISVNLKAPILFLAQLCKAKKLNKGASVVLMSSMSSFFATPAHSLYGATKGGLTAFAKGAALDLAARRIRVNTIAPAMVNTPLIDFSSLTEEQVAENVARYPLKRYGEPEDVASAAIYLLSDASSWVTGQQLVIDGGVSVGM